MKSNKFSAENRRKIRCLCYNGIMLKAKARVAISCIGVLSVASGLLAGTFVARQASADTSANATFQVNVQESLSVTITTPQEWDSGNINEFLRNKVGLSVTSNNASGFKASMYSSAGTSLTNVSKSSATLPTLDTGTSYACTGTTDPDCAAFPANHWGYSLDDSANEDGTYRPMVSSTTDPITIMTGDGSTAQRSQDQDIYFGAKADASKESGTYAGTVVISVVTGEVTDSGSATNDNPITPTNPASSGASGVATYDSTNDRTTYTTTSTSGSGSSATNSTTTTVSTGDTRSSYSTPAGVTTSSKTSTNNALAVALATTAGVAAVSSGIFFILAKRKKDDDEEEEEGQA